MAKLIQFRCPDCLKLLFKFNKETGVVEYHMSAESFNDKKYVTCPKCKIELEITKSGMARSNVVVGI